MPRPTDAKLLRRDMLTLINLLDNLSENWPDDSPPIPYVQTLRKRLAKSSIFKLPRSAAGYRCTVDVRLPRAEATATARILLEILAEQPGALGIQNPAQLREVFHVVLKLLPSPQGKRRMKTPPGYNTLLSHQFAAEEIFHQTTIWRRKKKDKAAESASAAERLKTA